MGEPQDAVEAEFGTDFAIVAAAQPGATQSPAQSYATTVPGHISMMAGSKYAKVRIRAERWGTKPPLTDDWEDWDELPFAAVPDGGLLLLGGFDQGDVGLDVSELDRARVQVLARGRHRYRYNSDHVAEGSPEEWLLRIYPHDGPLDPMAGGPKRIAGEGGLYTPRGTAWEAAVRGRYSTGWSDALVGSHGFYLASLALSDGPFTRLELAARMLRWMAPYEVGGSDAESVAIPPRNPTRPDPLAAAVGREIRTAGDAIDALIELGLLLTERRDGQTFLIVNPAPRPAWERLEFDDATVKRMRAKALAHGFTEQVSDIMSAVGWMGDDGLRATPRDMAIRWSSEIDGIVAALRACGGEGRLVGDRELGFDSEIDADEQLALRLAPR